MKPLECHQQKQVTTGRSFVGEGSQGIKREARGPGCLEGRVVWLGRKNRWAETSGREHSQKPAQVVGLVLLRQKGFLWEWGVMKLTEGWKALESRLRNLEPSLCEQIYCLPSLLLTNRCLAGMLGWGTRKAFETIWGSSPAISKHSCHYLNHEVLVPILHQSILKVARKLGMLEQLGSDYNNPLSLRGWRRSQVSPMPYSLALLWSIQWGISALGVCEFNAAISGHGWGEVDGRGGVSERAT